MRDMSETMEEDDDASVALRKAKEVVQNQAFPSHKKAKVVKKSVIPLEVPRRVKTRTTKANPKIVGKEWVPPSPPSSSSNKTTHDDLVSFL